MHRIASKYRTPAFQYQARRRMCPMQAHELLVLYHLRLNLQFPLLHFRIAFGLVFVPQLSFGWNQQRRRMTKQLPRMQPLQTKAKVNLEELSSKQRAINGNYLAFYISAWLFHPATQDYPQPLQFCPLLYFQNVLLRTRWTLIHFCIFVLRRRHAVYISVKTLVQNVTDLMVHTLAHNSIWFALYSVRWR